MNRLKRSELFSLELTKFVDKCLRELELSWAEVVGVMAIKLVSLILQALKK